MMVRSGQSIEYILNLMGSSTILQPVPATSSVSLAMFAQTALKSVYFLFSLSFSKTAYGLPSVCPGLEIKYFDPCAQDATLKVVG